MPVVHTSTLKRNKQDKIKRLINRAQKNRMREAIKKIRNAGSKAEAEKDFPGVVRLLKRMAQKRFIKKETADRYQSRLARHINKLS